MNIPTHPTHPKHIGRNTILCPKVKPKRARSWCFTWNNHTKENWHTCTSLFNNMKIHKMICQEEKGKNGTRHIQGFIQFSNAINFTTLKKIDEKIHWEVCRNIPASINYCSKKETCDGKSFKHNVKEKKEKYIFDYDEFSTFMIRYHKEESKKELQHKIDIMNGLVPPDKKQS